ncbi:MAG: hypothetical protein HIU82_01740 [Proteobacteria bacterium]|nr:hypothetical protein [Pseudomonadota bacterium]
MIAVLGQPVTGPDGKQIGRLTDVLVNAAGVPEAAVIDFGGFMGVGSRNVAVHWSTLRFHPGAGGNHIAITLTPAEIGAAPQYKGTQRPAPVVVAHAHPAGATSNALPGTGAGPGPGTASEPPHAAAVQPTPSLPAVRPHEPVSNPTGTIAAPIPFDAPATTLSTNPLSTSSDALPVAPFAIPPAAPLAVSPLAPPSGGTAAPR